MRYSSACRSCVFKGTSCIELFHFVYWSSVLWQEYADLSSRCYLLQTVAREFMDEIASKCDDR